MAFHSLDLGELGLVSTTSGLQVQVTSSVQLAAAEDGQQDAFAGYDAQQTWTTLAADFHIALELHLPNDTLTHRHGFTENLAQTLFDATVRINYHKHLRHLLTVISFGSNCSLSLWPK